MDWAKLPQHPYEELQKEAFARHLKKDETLFEIGDEAEDCYHLEKGALKVSLKSPRGEERIVALLQALKWSGTVVLPLLEVVRVGEHERPPITAPVINSGIR